jgi:hypothetical protein
MLDALEPDDILDQAAAAGEGVEVSTRRLIDALRRAEAEGVVPVSVDALPVFLAGMVGGALGMRVLKGGVGLAVAAGLGYWAWGKLQNPTPKKLPKNIQPGQTLKVPPPPRVGAGR